MIQGKLGYNRENDRFGMFTVCTQKIHLKEIK